MTTTACRVTTGFFVLGRCGRPAATMCRCGRPVCPQHVDAHGLCPECAAAQGYESNNPYDREWTRRYRRRSRERTSGEYQDSSWYVAFDAYDRGAFNPEGAYGPEYEGDHGPDYVDS